jgi:hypothetical protein
MLKKRKTLQGIFRVTGELMSVVVDVMNTSMNILDRVHGMCGKLEDR